MAQRKKSSPTGLGLYDALEQQRAQRLRRQRALFIPRLLRAASKGTELGGSERDRAHEIAIRWADRESSGVLHSDKETAIDTQFLDQLFGEGLGYRVKTMNPESWQLEHKFSIRGAGTADAAIGEFPKCAAPNVVIELKGATTDLDRDRFNGRTAVQQGWDYRNALPECSWVIVSNFSTIRLYHREKGTLSYEEFALQDLRDRQRFNDFYFLFEKGGLLPARAGKQPRALLLLEKTKERQKEVGDELYEAYQWCRLELIEHLTDKEEKSLDAAIRIAQKLLDRIIFIAFCEDRELLPPNCLEATQKEIRTYTRAKNPAWESFLDLFAAMDKGSKGKREITAFNGGLFADDTEINALELEETKWTNSFVGFGRYDFSEEVNVEVLGHLFERSITELEKLRVGGLFALKANADPAASKMPKSALRKRFGIYYTPPAFTELLIERTVDAIVNERFKALQDRLGVDPQSREKQDLTRLTSYWAGCFEALKSVTVCDPACGSGAFLIRAYDALDAHYTSTIHGMAGAGVTPKDIAALEDAIPDLILNHNLYGVDQSEEAVEITQLALWIRSARQGKTLANLSRHIVCGNSLVSDAAIDPKALEWNRAFPEVFGKGGAGGFTCVVGNPPWERVKVQDREFFSLTDPSTAEAVNASDRKKRIALMPVENPDLYGSYLKARERAQKTLDYARVPGGQGGRYPLTGKGDINLYMLFAELAQALVASDGLVGLLVPSGIATDDTTKEFFGGLMDAKRLVSLYDFENKEGHFEDVHRSFKFTALVFGGASRITDKADFVFFARSVEDTAAQNTQRHIPLTARDMALLNPNTRTCPIFRTRRDAELTKSIYKRIPILVDEGRKRDGNPWGTRFVRMFDQTNDAELFEIAKIWEQRGYRLTGNVYAKGKSRALPVYEAKMLQAYDHRAASVAVEAANWIRQGQKAETSPVQYENPEYCAMPRWWVEETAVKDRAGDRRRHWFLAYKDVTSATNERTMIATFMPWAGAVNSAPLVFIDDKLGPRRECCLLANLNSSIFDYVARQKVGGNHLNYFIVEQLPVLPPDVYADKCPWSRAESLEGWISERVLKLSCTAEDMIPLAQACDFKGSRGDGVHRWRDAERIQLRAELDAAFAHLYGVAEQDFLYMLSTFSSVKDPAVSPALLAFRTLASKAPKAE